MPMHTQSTEAIVIGQLDGKDIDQGSVVTTVASPVACISSRVTIPHSGNTTKFEDCLEGVISQQNCPSEAQKCENGIWVSVQNWCGNNVTVYILNIISSNPEYLKVNFSQVIDTLEKEFSKADAIKKVDDVIGLVSVFSKLASASIENVPESAMKFVTHGVRRRKKIKANIEPLPMLLTFADHWSCRACHCSTGSTGLFLHAVFNTSSLSMKDKKFIMIDLGGTDVEEEDDADILFPKA
ncbi:uncharacterized protein LOC122794944 [Protopterus annectens]|uniref:uncharacterized protein LOC122794944 n=1 Tax=Protopterus annectens TaxID=7888 RepID=UPI001CFA023E|nr:uncharacterized protein LOC122794944 [Protopterus annectens]